VDMRRDGKMDIQIGVSKEGYAGRLDVIVGPTGRQERSDAESARIAAENLAPDAVVSDVARRHGVTRGRFTIGGSGAIFVFRSKRGQPASERGDLQRPPEQRMPAIGNHREP
jgi:transposase